MCVGENEKVKRRDIQSPNNQKYPYFIKEKY
jgi:hypothetical protein